jgi:NAD(P)-dependent dehydrogenase (short-subunit alcohol dehydrogenase family)
VQLDLSGRRAVVTGAAAGIGRAIVEALVGEGARVLGVDRDADGCAALSADTGMPTLMVDVAEPDAGDLVAAAALEQLGGWDILVNNAGVAAARSGFLDVDDTAWQRTFEVNLFGTVRCCRAAIPHLIASGPGSAIVNVASTAGRAPDPGFVDYGASKAAVLSVTGALSLELGPVGVRVNAVSPGPTRTPLWDRPGGFADALALRYHLPREDAVDHHIRTVRRLALGRAGSPQDVADAVVFLCSARASHITGTVLGVHGGMPEHLL